MSGTLVLFDIDGTLLDAAGSGRWAMTRAFEDVFGLRDAEPFSRTVRFDGMTDPTIMDAIACNAGVPAPVVRKKAEALQAAFLVRLEQRLAESSGKRAMPGVEDLLERLASVRGAAIGLATGNARDGAMLKLTAVGLADHFDLGAFGDDASDRAGIARIAHARFERRLGAAIEPRAVILVGDTVADIEAARANGYRSLAVGTGWTDHDVLRAAGPDRFEEQLTDHGTIMRFLFDARG
ncbi:MAG: HAD family hydrolase [Acidobacteriota bacterium]